VDGVQDVDARTAQVIRRLVALHEPEPGRWIAAR